jgi:hypothetical protein
MAKALSDSSQLNPVFSPPSAPLHNRFRHGSL